MKMIDGLEEFIDDRGVIKHILPDGQHVRSVLYITGKAGAERGNHYHHKDTHYCCVLSGKIEYTYKSKEVDQIYRVVLNPGDVIFTPKGEIHKFTFITDGIFIAMATEPRSHESYESDTVRENI